MKKILSLALVLTLVAAVFAGCGAKSEPAATNAPAATQAPAGGDPRTSATEIYRLIPFIGRLRLDEESALSA